MPTYEVTAEASGKAVVYVTAANEDEAENIAYSEELIGITCGNGEALWEITDIRQSA
jgi:hypothetical protein